MAAVAVAHDPLSFEALTGELTALMREFPDQRTGKNSVYTMEEAALGAFSVFWTQSPSWLDHQRSMEQTKGRSNAQTLFGIERIPTDNCIRGLLDGVNPRYLFPMFGQVLGHLQAAGHLEPWRRLDGELLIALDGTQYHRSQAIHCEHCSKTEHRNGEVSYSHTVVTPVVVAPGRAQVIALAPEFVVPQDGHEKQDCETAAAKRWIATYGEGLQGLQVTLLGDDLYSRQPLCEAVLEAKLKFIFVAKPSSHITLYQWLEGLERAGAVGTHQVKWRRGKKHFTDTYRFASQLPLREGAGGLQVNWFEIHTTDEAGKTLYHNAWVTPHAVDAGNVAQRVEAGRARWKVENENNNTLKTKGYNLTHNFGHGENHLSALLVTLNLLAFLLHTVLDLCDRRYQVLRAALPSRRTFFNDIRALTRYLCCESLRALFDFMLRGLEIELPDSS